MSPGTPAFAKSATSATLRRSSPETPRGARVGLFARLPHAR
jgi:hypothetical protein